MEVIGTSVAIDVEHEADIGAARRAAVVLAAEIKLDEERTGDVALLVTELATNIVRHGGHGGVLLSSARDHGVAGIEIAAWDRGPGMNVAASLEDGTSSRGTRGVGLGAVGRIATRWDAYARPGKGTVVTASVFPRDLKRNTRQLAIGAVAVPVASEVVSGDAWDAKVDGEIAVIVVCDGLGHGPGANEAARAVVASFRASTSTSPAMILDAAHAAARPTRGAATTVVRVDLAASTITVGGVGNVQPWILTPDHRLRQLVTQHGTLGQTAPRAREETFAFPFGSTLFLHSDGLKSRWNLDDYPGLALRHPAVIAATLWRDLTRGRDDATIVVAREGA